jgi:hypothetical protein
MADNEQNARKAPPAVAGHFNGLFARDAAGAMAAVIVNPQASHAQRLAWALGQMQLLATVAEASESDDPAASNALSSAVLQLCEQSMAVIQGVLEELERPPEEIKPQPLRVV